MVQIHLPLPYLFPFGGTNGPLVKWLRHRPFTAATRVRISYGSPGAKKSRYALRTGSFSTHLPVEDVADRRYAQQNRGRRGKVSNKTQGASCSPPGARETRQCHKQNPGRDLPAARRATYRWRTPRCGVNRNMAAGDAAMSQTKPRARFALRQERVRRGNVTNEPQSASSRPGRGRVIPPREGCPPPPCRPAGGWPGGRWRRSPRRG